MEPSALEQSLGVHCIVTPLCHLFCAEFPWDLVWQEEEETTPKRYTTTSPLIFPVWSQKGRRLGMETNVKFKKWGLNLHTFAGSNNILCSLLIFEMLSGWCHRNTPK